MRLKIGRSSTYVWRRDRGLKNDERKAVDRTAIPTVFRAQVYRCAIESGCGRGLLEMKM